MYKTSVNDLVLSLKAWRLWGLLGWLEIRQRYARSAVGPFWLTISMGIMIGSLGAVYGTLFNLNLHEYLPYLAISLIIWNFFSQSINEGALAYIGSSNYIRQVSTPKLIFVFQVLWRNFVIFLHNIVIVVILLVVFGVKDWAVLLYFIPGLALVLINAFWIASLTAIVSARFRDMPQIIAALVQVAFYVSPILYKPEALRRFAWLVDFNPITYLLDLVRSPLIGQAPRLLSWEVATGIAVVGLLLSLGVTGRYLKRVPYWV